jgi:hypothetical protein
VDVLRLLRRLLTLVAGAVGTAGCAAVADAPDGGGGGAAALPAAPAAAAAPLPVRMRVEQLRNPYWYAAHGDAAAAEQFWDMGYWDRALRTLADEGYNAILYLPEPWQGHMWQTFLIRHEEFPEARDYTPEQYDRLIAHVGKIFRRAHELGIKNFLWSYFSVTTPAFAKAHGLDAQMPLSASVDYRHTLKEMGPHFGVRNELTRAFTEAAVAEVCRTYPELDGLCGGMGEALPGRRSAWFREAVVPGLKRCGREPVFIIDDWMLPREDFLEDVVRDRPWPNTWLSVKANGEVFTDPQPYPEAVRWAREANVPVLLQVMNLNIEANFPFDSPKLAHEIVQEFRRVPNCVGLVSWYLDSNPNTLFRHALGHYGATAEPYAPDRWVDVLEKRFGDRDAAGHFLNALDAAARIPAELCAFAWLPQDIGRSQILMLPYWHWTLEDPRWGHLTSPARGSDLLPLRHYARVVAKHGDRFRDNSGADQARNDDHPGAQELIWGLTRYPVTPEAHMRHVRRLGDACLAEAELAVRTVKANEGDARLLRDYMKAYQLLTAYYEAKVLAAAAALIHGFGGGADHRADAERLGDDAVEQYREAITFIRDHLDGKRGAIRGRWGRSLSLPELIAHEEAERAKLPELFGWPAAAAPAPAAAPGRPTGQAPMKHDFRTAPDGEAAERFRAWLERETTDGLKRAFGNPESTKTVIFLFVNRAFEAHMPEQMIGQTFGKCIARAGLGEPDQEAAISWLEAFAELARGVHGSD